jgi:hypothetical protein
MVFGKAEILIAKPPKTPIQGWNKQSIQKASPHLPIIMSRIEEYSNSIL